MFAGPQYWSSAGASSAAAGTGLEPDSRTLSAPLLCGQLDCWLAEKWVWEFVEGGEEVVGAMDEACQGEGVG